MMTYLKEAFIFFLFVAPVCSVEIEPQILTNAKGENLKIWLAQEESITLIKSAMCSPAQGWSEPVIISSLERNIISSPLFSMNKNGEAIVVWQSFDLLSSMVCMERAIYGSNHNWSEPIVLSDEKENVEACSYELHLDDLGNYSILWRSISPEFPTLINTRKVSFTINEF